MAHNKKITVKFYLSKKKEESMGFSSENESGVVTTGVKHPLYIQVIYNRNNTKFKCKADNTSYIKLDHIDIATPGLLNFEEKIIRKIIEYEVINKGDNFDLKGLNKLYQKYRQSSHSAFSDILIEQFKYEIKKANVVYWSVFKFDLGLRNFFTIYQVAMKAIANLNDRIPVELQHRIKAVKAYFDIYAFDIENSDLYAKYFALGQYGELFQNDYTYPTAIDWLSDIDKEDLKVKLKYVLHMSDHEIVRTVEILNTMMNEL